MEAPDGAGVVFDERGLRVDGRRVPMVGAEFHFWRVQALFWSRTLDAIRDAGCHLVSSFVCWDFHELRPGVFDFEGDTTPERDLGRFLELCAERDLKVILRPGPIIDAEWETRGPAPDVCTLERNDPHFRARAQEWLAAIARFTAPRQHPDGPVVLVAADNELYFPYASDPAWHDEDGDVFIAYKRDFAEARFRDWLRQRHASVEELNRALGTSYADFDEISAPNYAGGTPSEIEESFQFVDDYCAEYLDFVAGALREGGIHVPLYTNQKQFLAYLDWERAGRSLDSVGINLCMPNLVPGRQALSMAWFVRLQRARRGFPWSPEYQAGWIGFDEQYGVISPEHGLYMGLLGAALGLRGMSFFMFVERDDWNWSPLNSFGKIRPRRYAAYRKLCRVLGELAADAPLADVGLLWSLHEQRRHMAATTEGWEELFRHWMLLEDPKEGPTWWRTFTGLQEADADFVVVDAHGDVEAWPRVLVHAGDAPPQEDEVARLELALRAGRTLVCAGRLTAAQRQRLAAAGRLVGARPGDVGTAAAGAGAREFLGGATDLWSFAYADLDGSGMTAFIVNPTPQALAVELTGELAGRTFAWSELVTERTGRGTLLAALEALGPLLPAKSAYVFRLEAG